MSPKQLHRLFENRIPEVYDDQKTPTEIQNAEITSENFQQVLVFLISQIRQILGTSNWNDPVPVALNDILTSVSTFDAVCLSTDAIGDCVYSTQNYEVTQCNPLVEATMPASGIIIAKSDATHCTVQYSGVCTGVYGGLTVGEPLFIDSDGGLTQTLPSSPAQLYLAQGMGVAIADSSFIVRPDISMSRYV